MEADHSDANLQRSLCLGDEGRRTKLDGQSATAEFARLTSNEALAVLVTILEGDACVTSLKPI